MSEQLAAERALSHRSPTYGVLLEDGRTLTLRREADIRKRDGSVDRNLALDYSGETTWYAECDGRSAGGNLGRAIIGALGPDTQASTLLGVLLGIVELAVPLDPPIRLEDV